MNTLDICLATPADHALLLDCDPYARAHGARQAFLRDAVARGETLAARRAGVLVGFTVVQRSFFDKEFVSLIAVAATARRSGVASALLAAVAGRCRTDGLFTSTNQSNRAAQSLFARAGFVPSGRIDNLDPGDPELIYFKAIAPAATAPAGTAPP